MLEHVAKGDPHSAAHNEERDAINALAGLHLIATENEAVPDGTKAAFLYTEGKFYRYDTDEYGSVTTLGSDESWLPDSNTGELKLSTEWETPVNSDEQGALFPDEVGDYLKNDNYGSSRSVSLLDPTGNYVPYAFVAGVDRDDLETPVKLAAALGWGDSDNSRTTGRQLVIQAGALVTYGGQTTLLKLSDIGVPTAENEGVNWAHRFPAPNTHQTFGVFSQSIWDALDTRLTSLGATLLQIGAVITPPVPAHSDPTPSADERLYSFIAYIDVSTISNSISQVYLGKLQP